MTEKQLIILTGMSGAGKSTALRALEDLDFFCVDNLPPPLLNQLVDLLYQSVPPINRLAICIDIRGGELLSTILAALSELEAKGIDYDILFLEASDETLIRRYKESRRPHPLDSNGRLPEGIEKERNLLSFLKGKATYVLDSSQNNPHQFRDQIQKFYASGDSQRDLKVHILSFGFKNGLPLDADLVFDVRFLPNPYWVEELRELTGINRQVADYVMSWPKSQEFYQKLKDIILFLLPNYHLEGKDQLVIAIGCTGGQHRSVALSERLGTDLNVKKYKTRVTHRDLPSNFQAGEDDLIENQT